MQFSHNRKKDTAGEPSLTEMVEFAIKALERNPKGYVLLVEGRNKVYFNNFSYILTLIQNVTDNYSN